MLSSLFTASKPVFKAGNYKNLMPSAKLGWAQIFWFNALLKISITIIQDYFW